MAPSTPVHIRGDVIRLGQFLKLTDAVDTGGDVRSLLATSAVRVNGEVEARRGRQLRPGDVVHVGHVSYTVTARPGEAPQRSPTAGVTPDRPTTDR
jgi:ribosome-associated protein